MGIDLHYMPSSPPCRSVVLTANALGIDLNLKLIDFDNGELLTPGFLKMNPQHTMPTLNDNGFCLWESRAICAYLVNKYGKNDSLYPKDPKARAVVDLMLYFDTGTLYGRFSDYFYPAMLEGAPLKPGKLERLHEALGFFETMLEGQTWAAGSQMTIADFALVASVSTFDGVKIDLMPYPNIRRWFEKMKTTAKGYAEVTEIGVQEFNEFAHRALVQMDNKCSL